jgi:hypothetical protein
MFLLPHFDLKCSCDNIIRVRFLAFALEWSQAQQLTRMELQVVAGNPDGIRFYRQLGRD